MKIAIQTWGSNGDIRPMLALADGLTKAGHTVTLAISSIDNKDYSDICQQLGIRYMKVPEFIEFDMPEFAQKTMRMNTFQWLIALLDAVFFPYEQLIYQTALELADSHDCVIGHHFLYPLKLAALQNNKPHISVTFCHATIESLSQPPFRFPNLGHCLNRYQWQLVDVIFDWTLKRRLGKLWKDQGMDDFGHVMSNLLSSDLLNMVAVDPVFCPSRNEWQQQHQACGFLNLASIAEPWSIPNSLQTFLNQGDAPVYMTFGSLQQAVPDWAMALFVEAAQLAGCRAIIQTSSDQHPADTQQGDIYFIGRHPHQPLFKHCAAVVHHGGAGTTQSATISACPSIVIPFMDEQLFWGCRLHNMGLASKPLPARNVNAKKLAQRIQTVLANTTFSENADRIASEMQKQNGVKKAVNAINRLLKDY